jgi:glycosyltransferase involved in cell wall biosynthesis
LEADEPLRVGFVGRFAPIKGVDVLIDAVQRVPDSVPLALDLYGTVSNRHYDYYESLRDRAAPDPRITFCGELTSENRHSVYNSFDTVAVPSQVLETGPFVVLEAFAAGRPVVGSNLGGIAERVEDGRNGYLVTPNDPTAWASAFQRVRRQAMENGNSWSIPCVRRSQEVAREMKGLYGHVMPASSAAR